MEPKPAFTIPCTPYIDCCGYLAPLQSSTQNVEYEGERGVTGRTVEDPGLFMLRQKELRSQDPILRHESLSGSLTASSPSQLAPLIFAQTHSFPDYTVPLPPPFMESSIPVNAPPISSPINFQARSLQPTFMQKSMLPQVHPSPNKYISVFLYTNQNSFPYLAEISENESYLKIKLPKTDFYFEKIGMIFRHHMHEQVPTPIFSLCSKTNYAADPVFQENSQGALFTIPAPSKSKNNPSTMPRLFSDTFNTIPGTKNGIKRWTHFTGQGQEKSKKPRIAKDLE